MDDQNTSLQRKSLTNIHIQASYHLPELLNKIQTY